LALRRHWRSGEAWSELIRKVRRSALIHIDPATVGRDDCDCSVFDVDQSANVSRQVVFDPMW
jgi:hypothetical protein